MSTEKQRQHWRDAYRASVERKRQCARESYKRHQTERQITIAVYRATHREQAQKKSAIWRANHQDLLASPERAAYQRKATQKWQRSEKGRKKVREYVQHRSAQFYEYTKRWRKKNKERIQEIWNRNNERHRALKRGCKVCDLTTEQWAALKEIYLSSCAYCRRYQQRLTQDHIVPLTKGGDHTLSNIVPACRSCNSKKGNRTVMKPLPPPLPKDVIYV